jgi:hypothetical protein
MEAYSHVYVEPQELTEDQVWEEVESWVNSLLEEGYDLSEYTWEEMYEAYLEEAPMTAFQAAGGNAKLAQLNKGRGPRSGRVTAANIEKQGQDNLFKAGGGQAAISAGGTKQGPRSSTVNKLNRQDIINRGTVAAGAKPAKPGTPAKPTTPAKPGTPAKPAATTAAAKPTTPAKPAATTAPKPTTPASPAKPAGSAMDQWAKANPKLAAAKAERDRTRGTSATTNPLMKDTKSSMPAPKAPAPSTAKTGFDLAKKGTNLAAGVDLFDIVKGYLLDEGYAETEEGAMVMMVNMSEGWRESILESCGVELELDEGRRTSLSALAGESQKRKEDKERGRPESEDEKHRRLRLGRYSPSQYKYEKDEKGNWKVMGRKDGEED